LPRREHPAEQKRSRLNEARQEPGSDRSLGILRKGLEDRVSIVVARAAELSGELGAASLTPELIRAFRRFLEEPTRDKGCLAKIAIAEALTRLEHSDAEVFLKGIRHVQREPVWGGTEDTASWLRGLCALGLAASQHPRVLAALVDVLGDREKLARLGAVRALGARGDPQGALLLRLKLLDGDPEIEVISECFRALLALEPPAEGTAFVGRFLESADEPIAEAAALALGESRLPQAFDLLKRGWEQAADPSRRRLFLAAVALLRAEAANDFLVSLIGDDFIETARGAISALGPFLYSPELRERVSRAVAATGNVSLQELYEKELGSHTS
jgi:HEAT repeat protein